MRSMWCQRKAGDLLCPELLVTSTIAPCVLFPIHILRTPCLACSCSATALFVLALYAIHVVPKETRRFVMPRSSRNIHYRTMRTVSYMHSPHAMPCMLLFSNSLSCSCFICDPCGTKGNRRFVMPRSSRNTHYRTIRTVSYTHSPHAMPCMLLFSNSLTCSCFICDPYGTKGKQAICYAQIFS
jgi:hypothetical protein